ncbi:MAG: type II toxin-antitoxin system VapC family toxin [Acidobacteriales bacterium]|nr:type II toxin-antitoxin system VapC family toxin [Terriglobales bacterium]
MSLLLDTHAAIWHLLDSDRLSQQAKARIEEEIRAGETIYLPSISLIEVIYLVERKRLPRVAFDRLVSALGEPDSGYRVAVLDDAVAMAVSRIPRDVVPDLPDRVIAATALHLDLPLVSKDARIHQTGIRLVW